jgi:hypothetical protein
LFNKRGMSKKFSKEELVLANMAASEPLVLVEKRVALKKTRAKRNIPTTTMTSLVEALPVMTQKLTRHK